MQGEGVPPRDDAPQRLRSTHESAEGELSESAEEYVGAIWRLRRHDGRVGNGELAQYLGVQPASVTTMLKRLADLGLAEHVPYQGARCTPRGEQVAIALLRRHRLLERLLVDFVGVPWQSVHDLACRLEHHTSADLADRIAGALGYPATCPHGNPIDAAVDDRSRPLAEAQAGSHLVVARVTDEREPFLAYLLETGLLPGARIEVSERSPFGDILTLSVEGRDRPLAVGGEVARSVRVLPRED